MSIKGITSGKNSSSSSSSSDVSETVTSASGKAGGRYIVIPVSQVSGYFRENTEAEKQKSIDLSERQAIQLLKLVAKHSGKILNPGFYRSIQIILPDMSKSQIDSALINYRLAEIKGDFKKILQLRELTGRRINNYVLALHAKIAMRLSKPAQVNNQAKSGAKAEEEEDKMIKKKRQKKLEEAVLKEQVKERRQQHRLKLEKVLYHSKCGVPDESAQVSRKSALPAVDQKQTRQIKTIKSSKKKKGRKIFIKPLRERDDRGDDVRDHSSD